MSIQARFYVRAVERYAHRGGWAEPAPRATVKLAVVSANRDDGNREWASATASGEITMTIGNPDAAAWFESMLGKDVAVTFAERPEGEVASS